MGLKLFSTAVLSFVMGMVSPAFAAPFKCNDISLIEQELVQRDLMGQHVPDQKSKCAARPLKTLKFEQDLTGGFADSKQYEMISKNVKIEIKKNSERVGALTNIHFVISWTDENQKQRSIEDQLTYELYTDANQAEYGCAREAIAPSNNLVYAECFK